MNSKGVYVKKEVKDGEKVNSQKIFGEEAASSTKKFDASVSRVFIPEMSPEAKE